MSAAARLPHDLLPPGQVHLWMLPRRPADIERMRAEASGILSPDEKRRQGSMKHPVVADRFVLGRILLRRVLARYLGKDPADLEFRYNANGKPELADRSGPAVSFNLSHAASEYVLAVTRAAAVGIDLESVDRAAAALRIARRFFSESEIRQLESLGEMAPERALILWSLKESIVKANGETVWDGLARRALAVEGRRIYFASARHGERPGWRLAAGPFGDTHILAVAVRPSRHQMVGPLVFRTCRLGSNRRQPDGFKPEYRT